MKFTINTSQFNKALATVYHSISASVPVPSLTGILVKCDAKGIEITGSDFEFSIKTFLYVEDKKNQLIIEEEGIMLLDAKNFVSIMQKFNAPLVTVSIIDGNLINFVCGKANFSFNGFNPADYLDISFSCEGTSFKVNSSLFHEISKKIGFAASTNDSTPALTGINLCKKGNNLRFVTTDSFHLAMKIVDIEAEGDFSIIIPKKQFDKISTIMDDDEEVQITLNKQKAVFSFDNTIVSTKLIDNDYPDTSKMIPDSFLREVVVETRKLASAIDRINILRVDGKTNVKMVISEDKIILSTNASNVGYCNDEIDLLESTGEQLTISCSGRYLQESLKVVSTDKARICFNGELRPIIIKEYDNDSLILLISPIRGYE